MRRISLALLLVLLGACLVAPPAAAAAPSVTVSRTTGLQEGSKVTVTGSGIPAGVQVFVVQCTAYEDPDRDDGQACPPLATPTSDARGSVSVEVALHDVLEYRPIGAAPVGVYCRDDGCRIYLEWFSYADGYVWDHVESQTLEFGGSAATLSISNAEPAAGDAVTVSGTARGAEGRRVLVQERVCDDDGWHSGCRSGGQPTTESVVGADGTFTGRYVVQNFLDDGFDCSRAGSQDLQCRLTATVLDADGRPDDSFGIADIGDPGVRLSFGRSPGIDLSAEDGLVRGAAVTTSAAGLPSGADVDLVLCADWSRTAEGNRHCPVLRHVRTADDGFLTATLSLPDVVMQTAGGTTTAVLCRADGCSLGVYRGDELLARTRVLEFSGSPATIARKPASRLSRQQWVTVTGTAHGAEGRTITVVEQACYPLAQGRPCYGARSVIWGTVKTDGTYRVRYPAQRFLGDDPASDCAALTIGASCRITVAVLDDRGRRDTGFGYWPLGEPGAPLEFWH